MIWEGAFNARCVAVSVEKKRVRQSHSLNPESGDRSDNKRRDFVS